MLKTFWLTNGIHSAIINKSPDGNEKNQKIPKKIPEKGLTNWKKYDIMKFLTNEVI